MLVQFEQQFIIVTVDILFAFGVSGNYFLNAWNCFKAAVPLMEAACDDCRLSAVRAP